VVRNVRYYLKSDPDIDYKHEHAYEHATFLYAYASGTQNQKPENKTDTNCNDAERKTEPERMFPVVAADVMNNADHLRGINGSS
jgi:hypothetical protein